MDQSQKTLDEVFRPFATRWLAEQIGVNPKQISRWRNGDQTPSSHLLPKIAQATGVDLGDLVRIVARAA